MPRPIGSRLSRPRRAAIGFRMSIQVGAAKPGAYPGHLDITQVGRDPLVLGQGDADAQEDPGTTALSRL